MGANTNLTDRIIARQGLNVREIFQSSDFPTPAGGYSELEANLIYDVLGQCVQVSTGIQFPDGAVNIIDGSKFIGPAMLYFGTNQTFFRTAPGEGLNFPFVRFLPVFSGISSQQFLDVTGLPPSAAQLGFSFFFLNECSAIDFATLGQGVELTEARIVKGVYQNFSVGFSWPDTSQVIVDSSSFIVATGAGPVHHILGNTSLARITNTTFTLVNAAGSAVRIDPAIPDTARIEVSGNILNGISQTLFDTSGTSGSFTAASEGGFGDIAVTSVISGTAVAGGNRARFVTGSATVFVDQIIDLHDFGSVAAYNVIARVVFVTGNSFEVLAVLFDTTDTGNVSAESTVITSTAHGLSNGDTLIVDTTGELTYDGGSYVYNVDTNTFQISRDFVATQAGTWNTAGIDQRDPRVIAVNNPGSLRSKYLGCMLSSGNTATVDLTTTPADLVLGTLVESSVIERFKVVDFDNGTMAYTGLEPVEGFINFSGHIEGPGGAETYTIEFYKDSGSGFVQLPDVIVATTVPIGGGSLGFFTASVPISLNPFDELKAQGSAGSAKTATIVDFTVIVTA